MKSGAARGSTDLDKDVEILITQHSAKTARPWLSPDLIGSAMLRKSYQAIMPLLWIPGCMEDAVDGHLPTSVLIKDGVWKSPHQCPTILLVDFSVEFRHATNCLNTSITHPRNSSLKPGRRSSYQQYASSTSCCASGGRWGRTTVTNYNNGKRILKYALKPS